MKSFTIGQRVRLLQHGTFPEFNGKLGTIYSVADAKNGYLVTPDGWKSPVIPNGPKKGGKLAWHPDDLAPLEYDGLKIVKWEDCPWQPPKEETKE